MRAFFAAAETARPREWNENPALRKFCSSRPAADRIFRDEAANGICISDRHGHAEQFFESCAGEFGLAHTRAAKPVELAFVEAEFVECADAIQQLLLRFRCRFAAKKGNKQRVVRDLEFRRRESVVANNGGQLANRSNERGHVIAQLLLQMLFKPRL